MARLFLFFIITPVLVLSAQGDRYHQFGDKEQFGIYMSNGAINEMKKTKQYQTILNDYFDKIIQDENNLNYGLKNKLLIPALERHILALAKIEKIIFDESQGQILDNYIQQI